MSPSLCKGKCYTHFPSKEDPFRLPCGDGTKCILKTSRCDGKADCDDASDEIGCYWFTQLGVVETMSVCMAVLACAWALFFLFQACSKSLGDQSQVFASDPTEPVLMLYRPFTPSSAASPNDIPLCEQANPVLPNSNSPNEPSLDQRHDCQQMDAHISASTLSSSSSSKTPSFLLHPAFSDMDSQDWSWEAVGAQLKIEAVFFNQDPQFLLSFLSHIEAQDAHPDSVHRAFKGLLDYLASKGHTRIEVAFSMKQTIGHHGYAHMALKGPPNSLDRKMYTFKKWVEQIEDSSNELHLVVNFLKNISVSISPFLLVLDYIKDLLLYLILKGTVQRLEAGCQNLSSLGCLAVSGAEQDILAALLVTLCLSITATSLNSFYERKMFFRTNGFIDILFFVFSPLLPAIYHIHIASLNGDLEDKKRNLSNKEYQKEKDKIEKLNNTVQQSKSIEVGLEAIMQVLLLSCLSTFFFFSFQAPSGQTYSYFYGVAHLVLKGNVPLFVLSLFLSFIGPCMFFVGHAHHLKHSSLNVTRKLFLLVRNLLFLLVRVLTITLALFMSIVSQWHVLIGNSGLDASTLIEGFAIGHEFRNNFSQGLELITINIRRNLKFFLIFLFFHLFTVATHALLRSPKFGSSGMRERVMHLVSSFWLPLPFLSLREVDRGEEKDELWFLTALHSFENVCILLISRWDSGAHTLGQFLIHMCVVSVNIFGTFLIITNSKQLHLRFAMVSLVAFNVITVFVSGIYGKQFVIGLFVIDLSLVVLNFLAVVLSILYSYKFELFADLPDTHPTMPSFKPEVISSPIRVFQCIIYSLYEW